MSECVNKWRHFLLGSEFKVYTDHEALLQKPTSRIKQSRFLRILDSLSEYQFVIEHKQGISNTLADALSRRPDHYKWFLEFKRDQYGSRCESIGVQVGVIKRVRFLDPLVTHSHPPPRLTYLNGQLLTITPAPPSLNPVHSIALPASFLDRLKQSYADQSHLDLLKKLQFLRLDPDGLYRTPAQQLYIPDPALQDELVWFVHSNLLFHAGSAKTMQQIKRVAWWRGLQMSVRKVVKSCQSCQAAKRTRTPRPVPRIVQPSRPFEAIQIDFVWGLPTVGSRKLCGILTVVDGYSRLCRLIPVPVKIDAVSTPS